MNKNVKRYNIFFVSSNNIIIKRVIVHLKQRNFSKFLNQILQESHFPFIQRFINSIISAYPFHYSILLSISIYLKNPSTCRPRSTRSRCTYNIARANIRKSTIVFSFAVSTIHAGGSRRQLREERWRRSCEKETNQPFTLTPVNTHISSKGVALRLTSL